VSIRENAAALIFAHNHPSGDPQPSPEDIAITRQLVYAGKVMGLAVHEHIIIGDNGYFSFADHGQIAQMGRDYDSCTVLLHKPLSAGDYAIWHKK
jgi:DNA repair protein RadC